MEHIKKEVQNKINNELIKKKATKRKNTNKKEKTIKNNYNSSFYHFLLQVLFYLEYSGDML